MNASRRFLLIPLLVFCLLAGACSSGDNDGQGQAFTARLAGLVQMHGNYYVLDPTEGGILIEFSLPVAPETLRGNISLSDKLGKVEGIRLSADGSLVTLRLPEGFVLNPGWKYLVAIGKALRSTRGPGLGSDLVLEIRTEAANLFPLTGTPALAAAGRDLIVALSDVHMGEDRAADKGYCWFTDNSDALLAFVTGLRGNDAVRELVILGDLFDEWLVPYAREPYDPPVADDRDYFFSVRNARKNTDIMDVIADIAGGGLIAVTYVHGNHDMLLTQDVFADLAPGAAFMGTPDGLGIYRPVDGVAMEHGHRYDFFNAPQPLANPGHILPPGYFVSRLWASGMEATFAAGGNSLEVPPRFGDFEIAFPAAWDLTVFYTEQHFPDLVHPDLTQPVILMSGIDGYPGPYSFDGAKDMYVNGNIEANWPATQVQNQVNMEESVFEAIVNGQSNLDEAARIQYIENGALAPRVHVAVFGHTHDPMMETFPRLSKNVTGIYANTGSWVNQNIHGYIGGTPNKVRTFVTIAPAQWTGSALTVVTLYQYNRTADGLGWEAVKLAEDSVDLGA